tara:strand:+ start:125 stop:628 length:504 start_codon:yes stop_codon:yes gene_type:complete
MADQYLTKDYLNYLFEYKDGEIYWKNKPSKFANIYIGQKAGTIDNKNYKFVSFNKRRKPVHLIIYCMFNDYCPEFIDHKDRNTLNNLIENLRPVTRSQNMFNSKLRKDSQSNYKNIQFSKLTNKYVVRIVVDGVRKNFGSYSDIDYAKFVANAMRHKYHGEYARGEN